MYSIRGPSQLGKVLHLVCCELKNLLLMKVKNCINPPVTLRRVIEKINIEVSYKYKIRETERVKLICTAVKRLSKISAGEDGGL